jgi:acyl CoA:acetate/3-ketoacid CoA transferase beta subunit
LCYNLQIALLDMGPFSYQDEVAPKMINAGKRTATAVKRASIFSVSQPFAMIRGG